MSSSKPKDYIIPAKELISQGKFFEAIKLLDKLIALEPKNFQAKLLKANALRDLGDPTASLSEYQASEDSSLTQFHLDQLYFEWGHAFYLDSMHRMAVNTFLKIKGKPENKELYYYDMTSCLLKLEEYEQTLEHATVYLTIKPNSYTGWHYKGSALKGLNRYAEAVECFDKVLAIKPNYAMAYIEKGWISIFESNFQQAHEFFDKAYEINPESLFYPLGKAVALGRERKFEQAHNLLIDSEHNLYPYYPYHAYRAELFMKSNDLDKADREFQEAEKTIREYFNETDSSIELSAEAKKFEEVVKLFYLNVRNMIQLIREISKLPDDDLERKFKNKARAVIKTFLNRNYKFQGLSRDTSTENFVREDSVKVSYFLNRFNEDIPEKKELAPYFKETLGRYLAVKFDSIQLQKECPAIENYCKGFDSEFQLASEGADYFLNAGDNLSSKRTIVEFLENRNHSIAFYSDQIFTGDKFSTKKPELSKLKTKAQNLVKFAKDKKNITYLASFIASLIMADATAVKSIKSFDEESCKEWLDKFRGFAEMVKDTCSSSDVDKLMDYNSPQELMGRQHAQNLIVSWILNGKILKVKEESRLGDLGEAGIKMVVSSKKVAQADLDEINLDFDEKKPKKNACCNIF